MEKNKGKNNEMNSCNYAVIQNVMYCLKNTAKYYFPLLCWCMIVILINVSLSVLETYLPKVVIEQIISKSSMWKMIYIVLAFMGGIAVLSGINKFFTKYIYHQKYRMNTFYLRKVAIKGLTTDYINQENGEFRRLQTESFGCCDGNYSPLSNIYDVLIELFTSLLGISVFWIILLKLDWRVIAFLIATTGVSYFLNKRIVTWTKKINSERTSYMQRLNYINDASADNRSAKDIRLYHMAAWFSDIYKENMNGLSRWYRKLTNKVFRVSIVDSGLALVRDILVYTYLLYLVWNNKITVADYVLYLGVVTGFSTWLGNIFSKIALLNQLNLKINYYRSYLEYEDTFCKGSNLKVPTDGCPKTIELRNVSYRYESSEKFVLHNINLKIVPGEHLAIVGLNGAGKTTLVKLICGLINPTEGQVLYDGVDIREYNRTDYYKLISAVFQQFSILPVTIEEIVSETPAENTDHSKAHKCLETAGILKRIQELPKGVKSQFGRTIYDDGIELSGGEVQKLLLARALYKDAPLIVLDEPTAALDPIAESNLYKNYDEMSSGKTSLFISHRLASTRFCNRIILIENGAICEEGTHSSLLSLKGKYYELFEVQAKYYRENIYDMEVSE